MILNSLTPVQTVFIRRGYFNPILFTINHFLLKFKQALSYLFKLILTPTVNTLGCG